MDDDAKVQRRKQQRRDRRSKIREDIFIAEYVRYKHFNIYSEAVEFYNALNTQYPAKYDLRKADEFKNWKAMVIGVVKKPKRQKTSHANIQARPFHNLEPSEIHPQVQTTTAYVELSQNPSPSEQPISPDTGESEPASPSEQPISPDTGESEPASPSEQPISPDTGESEPASPSEQPISPDTGEPEPVSPSEQPYADNLQLRIPLISYKTISHTKHPTTLEEDMTQPSMLEENALELVPHKSISHTKHTTVTTETLQIVTEETLEEDMIQPSILEEIAPELIEKVIKELQLEPDLQDLFTSIEEQIEFEQLGMDIDIVEDNALENELELW